MKVNEVKLIYTELTPNIKNMNKQSNKENKTLSGIIALKKWSKFEVKHKWHHKVIYQPWSASLDDFNPIMIDFNQILLGRKTYSDQTVPELQLNLAW